MGIKTDFKIKNLNVNTSWQKFAVNRDVTIAPAKHFDRDTTFFTAGSCFANELRHALEKRQFTVFPEIPDGLLNLFPQDMQRPSSWGEWDGRSHLQFYNTFSIRQEFEKAFGLWEQPDDDYWTVAHAGVVQYWDPYRRSIYADSPENLIEIKRAFDTAMKNGIHKAKAAVITLGMTEAFFRKDNGLATCQYNRFFAKWVDFRATTFAENLANIDRCCELYFAAYPDRKLVLTVSPVALAQTFTDRDVVVANTESKSTLRVVAAEIAKKWPNVVYWPSYEICMWNENSWQPDIRHVHPDRVASIMDAFVDAHINTMGDAEAEPPLAKSA
jgi:GSCFA family